MTASNYIETFNQFINSFPLYNHLLLFGFVGVIIAFLIFAILSSPEGETSWWHWIVIPIPIIILCFFGMVADIEFRCKNVFDFEVANRITQDELQKYQSTNFEFQTNYKWFKDYYNSCVKSFNLELSNQTPLVVDK